MRDLRSLDEELPSQRPFEDGPSLHVGRQRVRECRLHAPLADERLEPLDHDGASAYPSSSPTSPYSSGPAGWYVLITIPVPVVLESTSLSAAGTAPSANRRFPLPMTTG